MPAAAVAQRFPAGPLTFFGEAAIHLSGCAHSFIPADAMPSTMNRCVKA